jgi:hypothetical protein
MAMGATRQRWLAQLFSTDAADRPQAEGSVRDLYAAAGFPAPTRIVWFDSPFAASWAVAVLIEPHHPVWRDQLNAARRSRGLREHAERAEAALRAQCSASSLADVLVQFGGPLGMTLQFMPGRNSTLHMPVLTARMELGGGDVSRLFAQATLDDPLSQAEQRLWVGARAALSSGIVCPTTGTLVTQSYFSEYTFSTMADDEDAVGTGTPPGILRAAWTVARTSGPWWPFERGAILTERPTQVHVDDQSLLHRLDGPALVYRDGSQVYAWHGLTVPEAWIMRPETVPPAELRGFDAGFRRYAESRRAALPRPAPPAKPSSILKTPLPADPDERLAALRAHASGRLPLYDRYVAGDHQAVWRELVAQGPAVRADPVAADALAVAGETMRRVAVNIGTVVTRLLEMGYRFTTPDGCSRPATTAHVPPAPRDSRDLQRLEKAVGALPLSLRVFYDIVGAIDLIGRHPTLAPADGTIPPDPLVVASVAELVSEVGSWDEDDVVMLAPDDLHKANTSGGDPYAIGVPDENADAVLLNERHDLLFVDYLRLCFRFGGFPGYEGQDDVPAEIDTLRAGLLEF